MSNLEKKLTLFLEEEIRKTGVVRAEWLSLSPGNIVKISELLSAFFPPRREGFLQEYIRKSMELRKNPLKLYPWAKSVIFFAVPIKNIPKLDNFIPKASSPELAGFIAAYAAGRLDYHIYVKEIFADFAKSLKEFTGVDARCEICVDTKPVAEKPLAAMAGLGNIGFNTCLLCENSDCACMIAEIFTSMEFPERELRKNIFSSSCGKCEKCVQSCPTGALGASGKNFKSELCRSYLSMEKKGTLNYDEMKSLGNWIFGCDSCISSCPGIEAPEPYAADLEWILSAPSLEIMRRIKNSALEYAGPRLLKRNALAVLANKSSEKSKPLLAVTVKLGGSNSF